MSDYDFTDTITIGGEDCDYDPVAKMARIYCCHCGQPNDVEVELENGEPVYMGFTCDKCMQFNEPEGC